MFKVEDLSNKIGRFLQDRGYQKDDCVAVLMENRLEYAAMWLGLSKVGIVAALLNYNLRKETLIHSIRTANSKAVIVSSELLEALKEIIDDEEIRNLEIFIYENGNDVKMINEKSLDLYKELENISSAPLEEIGIKPKDKLFYIYTSGTTGY
jgi:solute carrier family 27 fatty acid transporter 1/4